MVAAVRREDEVDGIACEIDRNWPGARCWLTVDVRNRLSLQSPHDEVQRNLGRTDIIVNSAGVKMFVPTIECSQEGWSRFSDIKLNGPGLLANCRPPLPEPCSSRFHRSSAPQRVSTVA